jgi:hypothetical protein
VCGEGGDGFKEDGDTLGEWDQGGAAEAGSGGCQLELEV